MFPFQNPSRVDDVPGLIPPFAAETLKLTPRLEFEQARLFDWLPIRLDVVRGERVIVSFDDCSSCAVLGAALEQALGLP